MDHQLESLTIIQLQLGMLRRRHQAHLDCTADIAEANRLLRLRTLMCILTVKAGIILFQPVRP